MQQKVKGKVSQTLVSSGATQRSGGVALDTESKQMEQAGNSGRL